MTARIRVSTASISSSSHPNYPHSPEQGPQATIKTLSKSGRLSGTIACPPTNSQRISPPHSGNSGSGTSSSSSCSHSSHAKPVISSIPRLSSKLSLISTSSVNSTCTTACSSVCSSNNSYNGPAQWDNFDRIVCLNLKDRSDRLEHMQKQFAKMDILHRVTFNINERSPNGGCWGCFESHWKAVKSAYDDGLNNVVIFEDDIIFHEEYGCDQVIRDCNYFVKHEPDWDFLCINGFILYGTEESLSCPDNIIVGKSLMGHAVCFSRQGMEKFLEVYPCVPPVVGDVDWTYARTLHKTYVHTNHHAIVQLYEEFPTDNPWLLLEGRKYIDERYKQYVQIKFCPTFLSVISSINLALYKMLPYALRPWLQQDNLTTLQRFPILTYRKKNGIGETSFPWKDGILQKLATLFVSFLALIKLTPELPPDIRLFQLLLYLLRMIKDRSNAMTNAAPIKKEMEPESEFYV